MGNNLNSKKNNDLKKLVDNSNIVSIESLQRELEVAQIKISNLQDDLEAERVFSRNMSESYAVIANSACWKMTKPIRFLLDKLKEIGFINRLIVCIKSMKNRFIKAPIYRDNTVIYELIKQAKDVNILATKHTMYVAKLIKNALNKVDITANIITEMPMVYEDKLHIVLCPNIWERMPNCYISVQMEQTISSRWFTKDYIDKLNNSIAVIDYSIKNVDYFKKNEPFGGMVYYVPADYLQGQRVDKPRYKYDIVFYGDPHGTHRPEILEELQKEFSVKIVSEVYGNDLYKILKSSKIVINIHYYENAMLETTRLYEVLSIGSSLVVSERSTDAKEDKRLEDYVDFVDCGDVEALKARLRFWINNEDARLERLNIINTKLSQKKNDFEFYFYRFMLAIEWISFDKFYKNAGNYVDIQNNRLCLSLPEDVDRRTDFDKDNKFGFTVVPGMRHHRGWTGCGLSYKYLIKRAADLGLDEITICEDDVFFPDNFEKRIDKCNKYLEKNPDWDVFQGITVNADAIDVKGVDNFKSETFVHHNRMMSMVYNRYKKSVYPYFLAWDETNANSERNTIDKALQGKKLKVVVVSPFIVGHKEDLKSTIWNFKNTQYTEMINESSRKLQDKVEQFIKVNGEKNC